MNNRQKWALFSFQGRMRRRDYWIYNIPVWIIVMPTLFYQGGDLLLDVLTLLLTVLAFYCTLALNMKRLKDRDRNTWWIFFTLIPVVGSVYTLIDLGCYEGTHGRNRYGDDPKQPQVDVPKSSFDVSNTKASDNDAAGSDATNMNTSNKAQNNSSDAEQQTTKSNSNHFDA